MVWICIPSLNLVFYDENLLMAMTLTISKPIKVDMHTNNVDRGGFARVCVEIELKKPVVGRVWIKYHWYNVEYKELHIIYRKCGCYGHHGKECKLIKKTGPTMVELNAAAHVEVVAKESRKVTEAMTSSNPMKDITVPATYGDWLTVTRKKKSHN